MPEPNGENKVVMNVVFLNSSDEALRIIEVWQEGREYEYVTKDARELDRATVKWLQDRVNAINFLMWKEQRQFENTTALLDQPDTQQELPF